MKPNGTLHANKHARPGQHSGGQERYTVRFGYELEPGDVLEATDLYDSTSGFWEPCPCPGLTIQEGCATVWIRPENPEAS